MSPDELRNALDAAFPRSWRQTLERRAPFYCALSEREQERFEDKVQHFVLTRTFSGVGRMWISDETKVVVAAAACRLTLNLPWHDYTRMSHVTLRNDSSWSHHGTRVIGLGGRWKVTLSYPSLLRGLATPDDGNNVGYHEFAHALDAADGCLDGEPQGPPTGSGFAWRAVIESAREAVERAVRSGLPPPIDAYAATSDVELFAVATEWFFERPHDLNDAMPSLYALLRDFYRQDPI